MRTTILMPAGNAEFREVRWAMGLVIATFALVNVTLGKGRPSNKDNHSLVVPEWLIEGTLAAFREDLYPEVRIIALRKLSELRAVDRLTVDELIPCLEKKHPEKLRVAAAAAIGNLGEGARSGVQRLIELLNDEKSSVRGAAAKALGSLGPLGTGAVHVFIDWIEQPDAENREAAYHALCTLGENAKEVVPELIELLRSRNRLVRIAAARSLAYPGDHSQIVVPALMRLLRDKDELVRNAAAAALGRYGEKAGPAATRLLKLLRSNSAQERIAAATALGNIGQHTDAIISVLIEMLDDRHQPTRAAVIRALGLLGEHHKDVVPVLITLLDSDDRGTSTAAAKVLSTMGENASVAMPVLLDHIKYNPMRGKQAIASAIGILGRDNNEIRLALIDLLNHEEANTRVLAATALGHTGQNAHQAVPALITLLHDKNGSVRAASAKALGSMGEHAKDAIPLLIEMLNKEGSHFSDDVITAIGKLGEPAKVAAMSLIKMLDNEYYRDEAMDALVATGPYGVAIVARIVASVSANQELSHKFRLCAYQCGGGDLDSKVLLRWLGSPLQLPKWPEPSAAKVLGVLEEAWGTSPIPALRRDLSESIAEVVTRGERARLWSSANVSQLEGIADRLKSIGSTNEQAVREVISKIQGRGKSERWVLASSSTVAIHASIWGLLIWMYPRFRWVQATFFWNPWCLTWLGLGYVRLLLLLIPGLQHRILLPFDAALKEGSDANEFESATYFPDSQVTDGDGRNRLPIKRAIPKISGITLLEGESGLGKTMFTRWLISQSSSPIAYLNATECGEGVLTALGQRLLGGLRDTALIESMLYCGALSLCIDGMNETTADTRSRIIADIRPLRRARILLTTQPMGWTPPSSVTRWIMQPLEDSSIERFLKSRPLHNHDATGSDFERRCDDFLKEALSGSGPLTAARRAVLSNPYDLEAAANLIASGKIPNLLALGQQQFDLLDTAYKRKYPAAGGFPISTISEHIYTMRLEGKVATSDFVNEMEVMEEFHMVLLRPTPEGSAWIFRHDRVIDFFVMHAFGRDKKRLSLHLGDAAFRGAYLMLADSLCEEEANDLLELISNHATDTGDHSLSDEARRVVRRRRSIALARQARVQYIKSSR